MVRGDIECGRKKIILEWRRDIVSNRTKKEKKVDKKEERKTIRGEERKKYDREKKTKK